jgi:hypothetical protein
MRAIIFILILFVAGVLIAVASGFLNIRQTQPAAVPNVQATGSGVTASGGQAPAFDIETGSVAVGTKPQTVAVPTVQVNPPANSQGNAVANTTTNTAN